MKEFTCDVAVMGSGLCGLAAAVTALEQGVKVEVFEKRPFQGGGVSNTPMQVLVVRDDPAYQNRAFKIHMDYTNWNANPHVVRKWLQNSVRIPQFIRDLGIEFLKVTYNPLEELGTRRGYEIGFPNAMHIGDYYAFKCIGKGHGAAIICKKAREKIEKLGGGFNVSTTIDEILFDEEHRVSGAKGHFVKTGEEFIVNCKALVVATGGFNDDPDMVMKELGHKVTDKFCSDGGEIVFNHFKGSKLTGDGQKLVWRAGGAKGAMGLNGHACVPDKGIIGEHCGWIMKNEMRVMQEQAYLWVNQNGQRFICEEQSNNHMAMCTAIYNQPGKAGYLIFDQDTVEHLEKEGVERAYFIFDGGKLHNIRKQFEETIAEGNDHVFMADTIDELISATGIDEIGLKEELERYNGYCEKRYDDELAKDPLYLRPVKRGPFYALKVRPGGYHAFGGIKIDGHCRVLDKEGKPIAGLYSGGDCCAGEVFGNPPIGGIGWSTLSFSEGFVCGDEAVGFVNGNKQPKY